MFPKPLTLINPLFPLPLSNPNFIIYQINCKMRHSWRYLLLRAQKRSPQHFSNPTSLHSLSTSLSDLTSLRRLSSLPYKSPFLNSPSLPLPSKIVTFSAPNAQSLRNFSSQPAIEVKDSDHVLITEIFTKCSDMIVIRSEIEANGLGFSHDLILKVLKGLSSSPDVARRFFSWVSENHAEKLSSRSYNSMLYVMGANGLLDDFWGLVDKMKEKGYGVSGWVRDKVLERFEKDGRVGDMERLKREFVSGSIGNSEGKMCASVYKIVKNEIWSDDVEKKLRELNCEYSGRFVRNVLEKLNSEPLKALMLFRWLEESGLFKHDGETYNVMARLLVSADCIDRFWKVVDDMKIAGYDMEKETFVKVLGQFVKRKMIKDAVYLYEFAMAGSDKPSVDDCTFLLRKIVAYKDLDLRLLSRVVKAFTEKGNVLTDSMVNAVLKSLVSVNRIGESNEVLKVLKESGFVAGSNMHNRIAYRLSSSGNKEEARQFVEAVDSVGDLDQKVLTSLIEGFCAAGDLEEALANFKVMIERESASSACCAFESLVDAYCHRERAADACKLLNDCAKESQLKPWQSTYKLLVSKLLYQGGFDDALSLLRLMKKHGYPPYVDPFIDHISKRGSGDQAVATLKRMTSRKFASTSVFLQMFKAFFKAGRHNEAQEFLAKCPREIRNHADVLDLFCSNSKKSAMVLPSQAPVVS